MRAPVLLLALAAMLGACASDRVRLLDSAVGGRTGAIAVLAPDGGETVLDKPNRQALLRSGAPRVRDLAGTDPAHAALIAALPPAARVITLRFPVNEARVLEDQRTVIETIRAELANRPGAQIEVAGLTDTTDSEERNLALSQSRARAVADELRALGFAIEPEDVVGRGEFDARAAIGDDVADENYRRVDVIIR